MNITKERKEEILKRYETDKALFNWCEEYKQFVNEEVLTNVNEWVEYMVKKSYEDIDSPISYEDVMLYDWDQARETLVYTVIHSQDDEDIKAAIEDINEYMREEIKTKEELEEYLTNLDDDETQELCDYLHIDLEYIEVYEWWLISGRLAHQLEEQGCLIIEDRLWGRSTTGQHISLDYCVKQAFLNIIKRWL